GGWLSIRFCQVRSGQVRSGRVRAGAAIAVRSVGAGAHGSDCRGEGVPLEVMIAHQYMAERSGSVLVVGKLALIAMMAAEWRGLLGRAGGRATAIIADSITVIAPARRIANRRPA